MGGRTARFRANAVPDAFEGSGAVLATWRAKWGDEIADFRDDGCGCCVHILSFEAPGDAIDELERTLGGPFERDERDV